MMLEIILVKYIVFKENIMMQLIGNDIFRSKIF